MDGKIQIMVNGRKVVLDKSHKVKELWKKQSETGMPDIMILNGFPIDSKDSEELLHDGDTVVFILRGVMPSEDEFMSMLTARNSPALQESFKKACVGIAGLGGLGSHVATALARTGVGRLVLVDYDVVEPSNLNRQCYDATDIGRYKVDALSDQICRFNPFVNLILHRVELNSRNVFSVFEDCDVVVEAFDKVESKAMLVNSFSCPPFQSKYLVTASGLAGIGSPNDIQTRRLTRNVIVSGDMVSAAKQGEGLMAPRVMVTAGHQATTVLRILAGRE